MKRLLTILLMAVILMLTACASRTESAADDVQLPTQEEVTQTPTQEESAAGEPEAEGTEKVEEESEKVPEKEPEKKPAQTQPSKPQKEPVSTPTTPSKPKYAGMYYIKVNCASNTVTIYTKDEEGYHTVPYMAMICSTGAGGSTPLGIYHPTGRRWSWLSLVGNVYGRYNTQIIGDYLFHSVPYLTRGDKGSLQPGEFDKLGTSCSHGCIRLQLKDAKWIYDNYRNIAAVEIVSGGEDPLGRPWAPKIGDSPNAGWDPSDMDPENPWLQNTEPEPDPEPEPKPDPAPETGTEDGEGEK